MPVIDHGHADARDVRAVGQTVHNRARALLADLVLIGAGCGEADLSEAYGRRAVVAQVAPGHGRGGGDGHRGAVGRGGDLEGERVGIRPVAAFEAFGEAEVELGLERDDCVVVLERDLVALLAVDRGRHGKRAVTIVGNGDLHRVLALIVRHATELVRALGHSLLHGERVRLSRIFLGEGQVVELRHGALLAGCCGTVREAAVGIGKKCLGRVVCALDREAELVRVHRTAVEHLGHGDACIVGVGDLVGIAEARDACGLALVILAGLVAGIVGHPLHRGGDGQPAVVLLIGHLDGHAVGGLRDAHAAQDAHIVAAVRAGLRDGVDVGPGTGVGDVAEVEGDLHALGCALGSGHVHNRAAVLRAIRHGGVVLGGKDEREFIFASPRAPVEGLRSRKARLAVEHSARRVGVLKLDLGGPTGHEGALGTHRLRRPTVAVGLVDLVRPAAQEALDRELLARLQGVRVHAVLVKGQREVLVALDLVAQGHVTGKALARGLGDADGKLEPLVREVGSHVAIGKLHGLCDLKASRALKRELAVVAEPREDLRAGPHGIDEARRGGGDVVGLLSVELVDVGEARRAGLDIGLPGSVGAHIAANAAVAEAKRSHEPLLSRGAVASQIPIRASVVVRLAALQRVRRAGGQCLVLVDGRVLADVVIAVGGGRRKARAGVAVRVARPGVGKELDAAVSGLMVGQVVRHVGVGAGKKVGHLVLQARAEEHANGEGQRRGTRALLGIDAKRAQRDERRRNLHGHVVARAGVLRPANLDDDAREVARGVQRGLRGAGEGIGVDVAARRLRVGRENLVGEHDAAEVVNLHVVAELVGKGHVPGLVLEAVANLGGIAGGLEDLLRDALKECFEVARGGGGLVVRGVGAHAGAEVVISRRVRVVARHGVHKGVLAPGGVGRVRAVEDSDGVYGRAGVLHGLGRRDGGVGNAGLEAVRRGRRAIGKEDHNLGGTRAAVGSKLGGSQLEAIVRPRGAGRLDRVDDALQGSCACGIHRRHVLHDLAVVVGVSAGTVGVVADFIGLIARKLHDRDAVPLRLIRNLPVALGDLVDKGVGCSLERGDALRAVAAPHRIVHRARGVEDEHDVEGRRHGVAQIRRGRKSTERREEVGVALLYSCGAPGARKVDVAGRDRLVGPDAAHVLGGVVQSPVFPRARGYGVGRGLGTFCGRGRKCRRRDREGSRDREDTRDHAKQGGTYGLLHRASPLSLSQKAELYSKSVGDGHIPR